jgi:SynChlorMet cassette protein ScmD
MEAPPKPLVIQEQLKAQLALWDLQILLVNRGRMLKAPAGEDHLNYHAQMEWVLREDARAEAQDNYASLQRGIIKRGKIMSQPIASPNIVLREEFDDWAILFDPDSGDAFGLNPVSVLIWKMLDGKSTIRDIIQKIKDNCTDVPAEVNTHTEEFIKSLVDKGYVGYEAN